MALVHSLAHCEAGRESSAGPPAEILDEASFAAARAGTEARLPDEEDRPRPVAELLDETIALVRPSAQELGCEAQLDGLRQLLSDGGGAGVQRAAYRDGGITAVLQKLREHARPA